MRDRRVDVGLDVSGSVAVGLGIGVGRRLYQLAYARASVGRFPCCSRRIRSRSAYVHSFNLT